ncbi:hypothetical protein [Candidatus Nitrospira inopinata]|jgi:hypothetical protein|uniref:Uncharacterized protein n=1 Tax=Candidatus Nitrospira inopinata TaxID=1715989 RepID=A0A0S4KQU1_9BACT|nr:hypothetical protein [Candidatus Nitrospira inopinata]CUQ66817.1 protein of unknown function [Candidatus Nitrospira inopinata]
MQQVNVGAMQVDPASAFVLAEHGGSRLAQLIYQPNNEAEQDARP